MFTVKEVINGGELIVEPNWRWEGQEGYGQEFKNEVFEMLPYQWLCSCGAHDTEDDTLHKADCITEEPNFKCGDVEIRWYKHVGRAMDSNRVMTRNELKKIFKKCMKSLK